MKSRITIEVDFENGNQPTIQILSKGSDDVRDKLIQSFYEKLGSSSWCKIVYAQHHFDRANPENDFKRVFITPIRESELQKEAKIMLEQYRLQEKWERSVNSEES